MPATSPKRCAWAHRVRRVALAVVLATLGASASTSADGHLVRHGPRTVPRVALTFDADITATMREQVLAGEQTHFDARILDELARTDTHATIFLTGLWAETYPDVVRRMAADPRIELGNHSYDHSAFREPCYGLPAVTTDQQRRRQVVRGARTIASVSGVTPLYFRFPGGCHEASDIQLVRSLGEVPVQWDTVWGDPFQSSAEVIIDHVLERVRNGSIVVMHLNGAPNAPRTYRALRTIIPELRARGYELVTLGELLAPDAPSE